MGLCGVMGGIDVVSPARIELAAYRLGGDRSIRLSYEDTWSFEYRATARLSSFAIM